MDATAEDVRDCYRTFLKREPEDEGVIRAHLEGNPRLVDLAARIINSVEYQRGQERNYLSLAKCLQGPYLAERMETRHKILIFTHHHKMLAEALPQASLEEVLVRGTVLATLSEFEGGVVRLLSPQSPNNEGELLLSLESGGAVVYQVGFSVAPAEVFGIDGGSVLFLSRMQGGRGAQAKIRAFRKAWRGLAPEVYCFECAHGIASALDATGMVGVSARAQICFEADKSEVFLRSYDQFFVAHGFAALGPDYFYRPLPDHRKVNLNLSLSHRKRAEKRRALRDDVARQFCTAWRRLSKTEPAAPFAGAERAAADYALAS